ncbi:extracellular solute-binding protein [Erysipelothrix sp. D19-032]
MYSGDASYILSENPDMAFYAPLQGTNVWSDTMVIPTNAQNPELAHEWMNFMISEDASTRISEEVGYTSPLPSVVEALTAPKLNTPRLVHTCHVMVMRRMKSSSMTQT